MSAEIMRAIGRLEGKVDGLADGIKDQSNKIDKMDDRVRKTELRSAANGMVAGGVMAVGIVMIRETFKNISGS